jgi:hypothetical protein
LGGGPETNTFVDDDRLDGEGSVAAPSEVPMGYMGFDAFRICFGDVDGPAAIMVWHFANIPAGGPMGGPTSSVCRVFRARRPICLGEIAASDYNRIGHLVGPLQIVVGLLERFGGD